jgi:hypothetical protein
MPRLDVRPQQLDGPLDAMVAQVSNGGPSPPVRVVVLPCKFLPY